MSIGLTEDSISLLQASDETLHLVLETVQAAVKAGELILDFSKHMHIHFQSIWNEVYNQLKSLVIQLRFQIPLMCTDDQAAAAAEAMISPLILNVWALNVSDPFISFDALDTLEVSL